MTFVTGNAVKEACELALDKWFSGERPVAVEHKWLGSKTTPRDEVTGACNPNLSYGYTAVYAEVEVNTETGEVTITRLICSDDVGKAINPQQVEGQLEGGLAHAIGFTLIENFIEKTGCVLTPNLSTYLVPLAPDMPEKAEISILEFADPRGPWGARGVGEMATVCTPPAIVSAVNRAIGTDFGKMPLVPEKVFFGLHK
jgi:CO/xanthine dehydrogenase Mo-binding subunit